MQIIEYPTPNLVVRDLLGVMRFFKKCKKKFQQCEKFRSMWNSYGAKIHYGMVRANRSFAATQMPKPFVAICHWNEYRLLTGGGYGPITQ